MKIIPEGVKRRRWLYWIIARFLCLILFQDFEEYLEWYRNKYE